jgi:hypothetical protein
MNDKRLSKLGKIVLFIVGLIPYIALSFLTVIMWDKYIGLTLPRSVGFWTYATDSIFPIRNILAGEALLGSWAFWYLSCKLIKAFL